MRGTRKSLIRALISRKARTLEKIKESFSEEEVLEYYKNFEIGLRRTAEQLKSEDKNQRENIGSLIGTLREVTAEAARRVSKPGARLFLSKQPKKFGQRFNVETDEMLLPFYEEDTGELRPWGKSDSELLRVYIRSICAAITALSVERADGGFTKGDLYRRVPEVLFLIDPFLHELKRQGLILFHHIPTANSPLIIYLKKRWTSADAMSKEVISKLDGDSKIPYGVVRTVRCSKPLLEKWEGIVDREKDC